MAQIVELVFSQKKFKFKGFVLFCIFSSILQDNKAHKLCFFNGFCHGNFFLFDTYFDATAITWNM